MSSYQLFAAPVPEQQRSLRLFSFPPLRGSHSSPLPTVYLSQNTGPQAKDTSPINHLCCTPIIVGNVRPRKETGLNNHASQGRFHLLPPAPHSRLNCRALHYSRIIHASLIKAVNSPLVKLENVQHLLSGNPVPGIGSGECQVCEGGLAKGCIDWLLNRSARHLCLILGAGKMPKGSLVPGIQAQKGEETGV